MLLIKNKTRILALTTSLVIIQGCEMNKNITKLSHPDHRQSMPENIAQEDIEIEAKIKQEIRKNANIIKNSNIDIYSFNKQLLIIGQIKNKETKAEIDTIINRYRSKNQFTINNFATIRNISKLNNRAEDYIIKLKIQNSLNKNNIDNKIKIVVTEKNVYLMGFADEDKRQQIIKTTKEISGVEGIIDLIY